MMRSSASTVRDTTVCCKSPTPAPIRAASPQAQHTGEAVSLGKINPDRLPDAVVCYVDSTIALPLITAYALAKHPTHVSLALQTPGPPAGHIEERG